MPQPIAPLQTIGGTQVYDFSGTAIAWNGQEFGTVWTELTAQMKFRRLFADGSPAGPIVAVGSLTAYSNRPALVWNGSGYGLAAMAYNGGFYHIVFARLAADGSLIAAANNPEFVSFVGASPTAAAYAPSLAWNGSSYAVVWDDTRGPDGDIYATLLNSDGTVANGGASHDLVISNAVNYQGNSTIAWSTAGNVYFIAWNDFRTGTKYEIYDASLSPAGAIGGNGLLVSGTNSSVSPSLVNTGSGLGMAWRDSRDGNNEVYFARLDGRTGSKIGADLRVTNDVAISQYPNLSWTGSEYGIVWGDNRTGNYDVWFQRIASSGALAGGNVLITSTNNMGIAPQAAFGRHGYLLTAVPYAAGSYSPNYSVPVGCGPDTTPPTCPGGFVAYGITGTTATVGWLPSDDPETDLAYYQVYRNAVPVGRTSNTYFNDSGLSLSGTYGYAVQPVNAAQLQNSACTTTFYIKTNATLTLTMSKATASDAGLAWTNANFNNYNIFRGTDPRVMSQIGSTPALSSTDPNVLPSPVSYFYSVDNPGP